MDGRVVRGVGLPGLACWMVKIIFRDLLRSIVLFIQVIHLPLMPSITFHKADNGSPIYL